MIHPQFDPIAISLGPVAIRWYGLMYVLGFLGIMLLGRHRIRTQPWLNWNLRELDDLIFYGVLGTILGGRLGYILFYKLDYYLAHPLEILYVWQGGMSFHGGFLGVIFAMFWFARQHNKHWFSVTDFVAPLVPPGLMFGRIGNFINQELPGRETTLAWGMQFPAVDNLVRHPSQLYQAAGEGLLLFIILWIFTAKPRPLGTASGVFLLGYGILRFLAEFTREPDDFLGLLALNFTMGQWLSLPMIIGGIGMVAWAYQNIPLETSKLKGKSR